MYYRRFGRTELQMPVLSCGGMRYQQSWNDLPPEAIEPEGQRNLEATIERSLELGINHIETARGYGSSEMQLGRILPRLPREKMIVQTKVAPFATAKEFRETFETSMAYLKLDYVDLLTLHGVNNAELLDWSLRKGGCLEEARKLQREGRARHIGFTTHATIDLILRAVESDGFDYMNVHWYFVNELNWSAVEAAAARDMGVFIISPTDKGGMLYDPPPKLVELCRPLSPIAFNDLFCLARPQVHTLSLGAARPSDFDEHVAALAHYHRGGGDHRADRAAAARGDGARARARLVRRVVARSAAVRRSPRRGECAGNPAALDLREGARSRRLGQDALQPDGQRRPLVSRRERGRARPRRRCAPRWATTASPSASPASCRRPTR